MRNISKLFKYFTICYCSLFVLHSNSSATETCETCSIELKDEVFQHKVQIINYKNGEDNFYYLPIYRKYYKMPDNNVVHNEDYVDYNHSKEYNIRALDAKDQNEYTSKLLSCKAVHLPVSSLVTRLVDKQYYASNY